ncbi:hypothetical protein CHU92_08750 [Flavobacterium cyanobacteriorum]|uniref:DgsA anti-repressor MtfA n=1 Tax=Flavobacterium cyanobacteriorum TaxID=2022802 RepID=A0A255Z6Z8_9FLAO|nr:zinc-dependent peptidase [Flavobacterium cyanobacteriorum]OYQ37216.1 hypothetical protein CHU92_08750 [Flavobacterium cyanobacteriorum]
MGEAFAIFVTVVVLLMFAALILYTFFFISVKIIESAWMMAFNKPLYVHFYLFPKELQPQEQAVLQREFSFYRNLPDKRKRYFRHRVHCFIKKYKFFGRKGLEVTEDMKLVIAGTWVMLTFGMRRFLPNIFKAIILYPDIFESANGNLHKGEFNYGARAVVFSWKHFVEGMAFTSDNLNLGLHEFAHALHIDSVKQRGGASAIIYSDMFDKIMAYVSNPDNAAGLREANYLREYAYTNQYEFIAVALEYFFETPKEFRQKLPALYDMVAQMINFEPVGVKALRKGT